SQYEGALLLEIKGWPSNLQHLFPGSSQSQRYFAVADFDLAAPLIRQLEQPSIHPGMTHRDIDALQNALAEWRTHYGFEAQHLGTVPQMFFDNGGLRLSLEPSAAALRIESAPAAAVDALNQHGIAITGEPMGATQ